MAAGEGAFEIFSSELELYNSGKLIVRQEDYSYDVMKETFVNSGKTVFQSCILSRFISNSFSQVLFLACF